MVSHCHFLLIQNNKFDIILLSILSLTLSKSIPLKSILLLNAKICHRCLTFYNTNPSDNPRVSIPREFGCMFAVHFLEPLLISRLTKNLIPTGALLCHDPHQGPWFKITWIFVHQRKQWIRAQSGLIRSFDASWLEWSWIINLDPDLPREMHLTCIVQARSYLVTALACINILMLGYVIIQHPIH